MSPLCEVVILTALQVEYKAVLHFLQEPKEVIHPSGTIYHQGTFVGTHRTWRVAVAEIGMGGVAAALEAEKAISFLHAQIALFVGVAGGLKDVRQGDVVAATKVYAYEAGKAGQRFEPRPDLGHSSHALEQRARAEARGDAWLARLEGDWPDPVPNVWVGAIAAGEKVLASKRSRLARLLKTTYGDALAFEMESHGFLHAVRVNHAVYGMVIRGISDLIDDKTEADASGTQGRAARHAAAFAFQVLAEFTLPLQDPVSSPERLTFWNIPFAHNQFFTGRDELLSQLHTQLQATRTAAVGAPETVTQPLTAGRSSEAPIIVGLVGMGGSGKTHLAVELACSSQGIRRFPGGIFWLPVTEISKQGLIRQFAKLAGDMCYLPPGDNISLPENEAKRARHICQYLVTHTDVLLILDNVDQIEQVLNLLPNIAGEALRCSILYTSHNEQAPAYVRTYKVAGLTEADALRLLLEHRPELLAHVAANPQSAEAQAASAICQYVGWLPLALALLRDLLRDKHTTLELLWQAQRQRGTFEITSNEPDVLKARLFGTIEQNWQKVESEAAQRLFLLATRIPEAAPIPLWILSLLADLPGNNTSLDRLGRARWELQRWNLIEELANDTIRLHPLLREFGDYVFRYSANAQDLLECANMQMRNEFLSINRLEQRARVKGYWNCLVDVQEMLIYARMLNLSNIAILEQIERWLARDSTILGDSKWWPGGFPGLFYQQLHNRAIEEGFPPPNKPLSNSPWLRQMLPSGAREQSLIRMFRHPATVWCVAFSSDNRYIASGCEDRMVHIWNVESGRTERQLSGHIDIVTNIAFSPESKTIATCSYDRTARIWNVESGQQLHLFRGHTAGLNNVVFSWDGKRIATTSSDCTTRIWDTTTGELIALLAHQHEMTDMAFSPDGLFLATHTSTQFFDGTTLQHRYAGEPSLVVLWDIEREAIIATQQKLAGGTVAFSSDGYLLYCVGNNAYRWDFITGNIDRCFEKNGEGSLYPAIFSPDGTYLAERAPLVVGRTNVQLWQISDWQANSLVKWQTYQHNHKVYDVAISPDNTKLAMACEDNTVLLWAIPPVPQVENDTRGYDLNRMMHFSYDGSFLIAITAMQNLMLWEVATKKLVHTWELPNSFISTNVLDAAISSNNKQMAVRRLESLWLIDLERGSKNPRLVFGNGEFYSVNHEDYISSIVFSPNGEVLVAYLRPRTAFVWHLRRKRFIATLQKHEGEISAIVFSPNGSRVLTGSHDGNVLIWNTSKYQVVGELPSHQGGVKGLVVSPDNSLVASSALDGSIYLWSIADGKRLATVKEHTQGPETLSFSSDSRLLISADAARQVRLWRIDASQRLLLVGIYSTPYEVKAAYWYSSRLVMLVSDGGEQYKPCFYRLALEGDWE